METSIFGQKACIDFDKLVESDLSHLKISIFEDVDEALIRESDVSIFQLWVEFGHQQEKTIMMDIQMNDLELFATSILKQIEIVRKYYGDEIKQGSNFKK